MTLFSTAASDTHGFAGTWQSTFGKLMLQVSGARVTGAYGDGGELQGKLKRDALEFTYSEPGESGCGTFRLLRFGKFTGSYTPEGATHAHRWDGERGWDGVWQTTFGRMRLIHEADRVHGFYDGVGNASIDGKADGTALAFRYTEPTVAGEGRFEMGDDGESFSGQWRSKGTEEWQDWTGRRLHAQPRITWLVVIEAHWQRSLAESEYAFGNMLREVFARLANIRVRQRFFHDADSLAHWCRELMYLPEPAVLVIASHGTPEGLSVHGEVINSTRVMESLQYAESLKLLHFSSCLVGQDGEKALKQQRFAVSGYTTSVDWGASAMLEFTYLDMILNRDMQPVDAARMLPTLVTYAGEDAPEGSPYPGAGFRFFPAR